MRITAAVMLASASVVLAVPMPTHADLRLRALQSAGVSARPRPMSVTWVIRPALRRPGWVAALGAGTGGMLAVTTALTSGASHAVVAPTLAGVIVGAVSGRLASMAAKARTERRLLDSLTSRVAAVAAEIRAGQSEAAALHSAAAAAEPELARLLASAGDEAAGGGDVASRLRNEPEGSDLPTSARSGVRRLAAAWATSRDCGAPIAGVLDHVHQDLNTHRRRAQQMAAHLAGPRATAALLSLLPLLGIILGSAAGTDPIRVLLATPVGQVALVAGVTLDALGVLWTAQITHSAGRSP